MASRAIWKGAISFGLVHIPVALHSATSSSRLDFDWLDKRSLEPVGYKRINKTSGREIKKENIVKGIQHPDGGYVVLSDDEIKSAYPKTTQTIEIECFVSNDEISRMYLEKPSYIAPSNKSERAYSLLRETMLETGQVGIARVVIQTRQYLAALAPCGAGMVLNLLRWAEDIRPLDNLELPPEGVKGAGLSEREMEMAGQLVKSMTGKWNPSQFKDSFKEKVMALVESKLKQGKLKAIPAFEETEQFAADGLKAQVIDLTDVLQRSLRKINPATTRTKSRRQPTKSKLGQSVPLSNKILKPALRVSKREAA